MSSTRAMRRKAQRALLSASMTADQVGAMVEAMNNVATAGQKAAAEVVPDVVAKCQKKIESDVIPRVQGTMCLLFFGWLAFAQKDCWGKKRLTEGLLDYNLFCDINGQTDQLVALKQQLREEKGFDIDAVFERAGVQSEIYKRKCEEKNEERQG